MDKNGNTKLSIKVKSLALPEKVAPDTVVYVVLVQPDGAQAQNVGALEVNGNFDGSLDLSTPHRRFLLSVSPESSTVILEPAHGSVLTTVIDSSQ